MSIRVGTWQINAYVVQVAHLPDCGAKRAFWRASKGESHVRDRDRPYAPRWRKSGILKRRVSIGAYMEMKLARKPGSSRTRQSGQPACGQGIIRLQRSNGWRSVGTAMGGEKVSLDSDLCVFSQLLCQGIAVLSGKLGEVYIGIVNPLM